MQATEGAEVIQRGAEKNSLKSDLCILTKPLRISGKLNRYKKSSFHSEELCVWAEGKRFVPVLMVAVAKANLTVGHDLHAKVGVRARQWCVNRA
jgi:hypothetical protein